MDLIRHSDARDLRVDFFRGLALWWIFVDHIPGNILSEFSLRNYAFCDATEIFVLLAGYGAGLSYGAGMHRNGYLSSAADVVRRVWVLYVAHIFLFMLYTAQVTYSAIRLDRLDYLQETQLNALGGDPYGALTQAMLLRFQPSLLNILPLYVVLLSFFAATIWLLRWPRVLFCLSFAGYVLTRATGLNFSAWNGNGWFFDPMAWQFLFVIGVLLADAPMRMPRWPRVVDACAGAVVCVGAVVAVAILPYPARVAWMSHSLLALLVAQDKTFLHPLRLAEIMSLTWICVRLIPFGARWLRSVWVSPLVLMGQNSLPVFCTGIVLGFVARLGLDFSRGTAMQLTINLLGVAGEIAVGAVGAWYRTKGKRRMPQRSVSLAGARPTPGE